MSLRQKTHLNDEKAGLKRIFGNISLKAKLMFFFVLVTLVPTIVVGLVSYKVSETIVKNKEIQKNIMNLRVVDSIMSNYLDGKRELGAKLASNKYVVSFMESIESGSGGKAQSSEIQMLLNEYGDSDGVKSIYMFNGHGNIFANDRSDSISYNGIISWYPEILTSKAYIWGEPVSLNGLNIIPLYIDVKDPKTGKSVGIILLNIDENYVSKLYGDYDVPNGELLVLNENGVIVSCKNKYQLRLNLYDVFRIDGHFPSLSGYLEKKVTNDDLLVTYFHNSTYNWNYLSIERIKVLIADSETIKHVTVIVCTACLIFSLLFSFFLSMKLTKPLKKLVTVMKEVEAGNLDIRANFRSEDEVGLIGNAFDNMVRQLQQSISDIYLAQRKLRESEMKILQMQINPHFLYNTLTSIIWLANGDKKKEVIEMVSALSGFFRISLGNGDEFIALEEEVEQVRNYLIIQKIRYKNEFDYEFDIGAEVHGARVFKFILQPLVENSINHGVESREEKGMIIVRAFADGGRLAIEVLNDGAGMGKERLELLNRVLSGESEASDFGIGTTNVNSRIKLLYGKEYGLSYREENGWTIARVSLPLITDQTTLKNEALLYPDPNTRR